MKIRLALLVSCCALATVVVAVIFRSTDEEWRKYQQEYYDLAMGSASTEAARDAIAASGLEIRQDILSGFGEEKRIDRCRTCHMAVDDPNFVTGKEPLRTHPEIPEHNFNEYGCTICHDGDGRGLTTFYAHGDDEFWNEPLLESPYIESSCARCHPEPYLPETPHLSKGRALFEKYNCNGCHAIRNLSRGKLGPDLTNVGARWKIEYLEESIRDPRANSVLSVMPYFNMPEEDKTALVVFLKSRRGRTLVEDPITLRTKSNAFKKANPVEVPLTIAEGRKLVKDNNCVACHKLGDADGKLAPDLTHLGNFRNEEYIAAHLADPRAHTTGSNMPNFWFSPSAMRAIGLYLEEQEGLKVPVTPKEQYTALCVRCHGPNGDGNGLIADNLLPKPRDFTNQLFFNWLEDSRAHDAIKNGVPGTAMPPFGRVLTEEQINGLFAYVRGQYVGGPRPEREPRTLPEKNSTVFSAESVERGRATFQQRCFGCHGRRGDGKGPNAPDLLPRPRDLTSNPFMSQVADSRLWESITYGVPGTGMPPWDSLSEEQKGDLINFVRDASKTGPAAVDGGKQQ